MCWKKVDWKKKNQATHHFQFLSFKHMDLWDLEKMAWSGSLADLLKLYICQMMMTWYCVNILSKVGWCFAKCTFILVMWLLNLTRRMEFPTFNSVLGITAHQINESPPSDRMLTFQELLNTWRLTVRKKKITYFLKAESDMRHSQNSFSLCLAAGLRKESGNPIFLIVTYADREELLWLLLIFLQKAILPSFFLLAV